MEVWVKQNHIYSEGIPGGGYGNVEALFLKN